MSDYGPADSFGYCATCYHPLDACSHCDCYKCTKKTGDPLAVLVAMVLKDTQRVVAKRLGFSDAYICDVLKHRREVSAELARRLGFERAVVYYKAKSHD